MNYWTMKSNRRRKKRKNARHSFVFFVRRVSIMHLPYIFNEDVLILRNGNPFSLLEYSEQKFTLPGVK
jgi:hypothetical protein